MYITWIKHGMNTYPPTLPLGGMAGHKYGIGTHPETLTQKYQSKIFLLNDFKQTKTYDHS